MATPGVATLAFYTGQVILDLLLVTGRYAIDDINEPTAREEGKISSPTRLEFEKGRSASYVSR